VIPVFRVAHPALDSDGRQVGEANVFPARLRLDLPTEWRGCQYAGSRYRDDMPMNVTALKAMTRHWKPVLATLRVIRAALRERLGGAGDAWTIGELHVLACTVLALPAFLLMRRQTARVPAALSSLFRVTDGIRMVTHDMVFSIERTRRADEPLTAAGVLAYAERHGLLLGETGVCAGPPPMIEAFLACAVDGARADAGELSAEVCDALADLPAAIDYALYGMQVWSISRSLWLAMSRAYQALIEIFEATALDAAWLRADQAVLARLQIANEADRRVHWNAYADAYAIAWASAG
jgi:hypothetical protein